MGSTRTPREAAAQDSHVEPFEGNMLMSAPNAIKPQNLYRLIGTPDAPCLIDVTSDIDFNEDPFLLPTAERCCFLDHEQLRSFALRAVERGRKVVIICQKGKKLSQGAAARLRAEGLAAQYLHGGNQGWREAGLPRLSASRLPPRGQAWVTRQRPKIDRIACPWLIARFIDRDASFMFVETAAVLDVAEKFSAIAFDAKNAEFSHTRRGSTFSHLLEYFSLDIPALSRMSDIITAADLGHIESVPEAAGLLAISIGLSRQFKDDNHQLAAALPIYDALFRWARDGTQETHSSQFGEAS